MSSFAACAMPAVSSFLPSSYSPYGFPHCSSYHGYDIAILTRFHTGIEKIHFPSSGHDRGWPVSIPNTRYHVRPFPIDRLAYFPSCAFTVSYTVLKEWKKMGGDRGLE